MCDPFSVSGDLTHREDVFKMAKFMEDQLQALGVQTRSHDLGTVTFDGHEIQLPPAILGKIGEDPKKKTMLLYGHFDVQPVSVGLRNGSRAGGTEPFEFRL